MDRNEHFDALPVSTISIRLPRASVQVSAADTEELQVLVSGAQPQVEALKIDCSGDRLTIRQPRFGFAKPGQASWLQVTLRIPLSWKGALSACTGRGALQVEGLRGTDLTLSTLGGALTVTDSAFISLRVSAAWGAILLEGCSGETCRVRAGLRDAQLTDVSFQTYRVATLFADASVDMAQPFQRFGAGTLTGTMRLYAPIDAADAVVRSLTGRIRTGSVSIVEGAPVARLRAVSGSLDISNNNVEQA